MPVGGCGPTPGRARNLHRRPAKCHHSHHRPIRSFSRLGTPASRPRPKLARAEGGFIDVTTPAPNIIVAPCPERWPQTATSAAPGWPARLPARPGPGDHLLGPQVRDGRADARLGPGRVRAEQGEVGRLMRLAQVCLTPVGRRDSFVAGLPAAHASRGPPASSATSTCRRWSPGHAGRPVYPDGHVRPRHAGQRRLRLARRRRLLARHLAAGRVGPDPQTRSRASPRNRSASRPRSPPRPRRRPAGTGLAPAIVPPRSRARLFRRPDAGRQADTAGRP